MGVVGEGPQGSLAPGAGEEGTLLSQFHLIPPLGSLRPRIPLRPDLWFVLPFPLS